MRAVVQRVSRAQVRVGDEVVGAIGRGLCVLVGATHDDDAERCDRLAAKLVALRVFEDDAGKMNRSVTDVGGSLLVVSQFTVYGDARRGNRPSFVAAARPEQAEPLLDRLVDQIRQLGVVVATGRFRADMEVELVNDGPVTLVLDT